MKELVRIFALILIALFLLKVVVLPLVKAIQRRRYLQRIGKKANGIVVGVKQKEDTDKKIQFTAIISFTTDSGQEITFESDDFQFKRPETGKNVEILYDPKNPNNAILNSTAVITFGAFFVLFLLLVLFFIGLAIIRSK